MLIHGKIIACNRSGSQCLFRYAEATRLVSDTAHLYSSPPRHFALDLVPCRGSCSQLPRCRSSAALMGGAWLGPGVGGGCSDPDLDCLCGIRSTVHARHPPFSLARWSSGTTERRDCWVGVGHSRSAKRLTAGVHFQDVVPTWSARRTKGDSTSEALVTMAHSWHIRPLSPGFVGVGATP
jgi:hypothetical protein